jgi:hypothetical protein
VAGSIELLSERLERVCSIEVVVCEATHDVLVEIISDYLVTGSKQSKGHVAAHSAKTDHPDLHDSAAV